VPAKKSEKPSPREYKLDPENARIHEERDSDAVAESLEAFGAGRSIVVDNEDYVVAGNSTYEQAKKLGIPILEVETEGEVLVAIKRKDLSREDEKRIGLALADNRTQELSRFDDAKVDELLDRIRSSDLAIDLERIGFETIEIDELGSGLGEGLRNRRKLALLTVSLPRPMWKEVLAVIDRVREERSDEIAAIRKKNETDDTKGIAVWMICKESRSVS